MPKISDIEETPNPNAVKFILREPVSNGVARQYGSADLTENDPLAKSLFDVGHVVSVFYMDKMITVEKDDEGDWDELLPALAVPIRAAEAVNGAAAAAAAAVGGPIAAVASDDPRLLQINEILDEKVRPALMGDGGHFGRERERVRLVLKQRVRHHLDFVKAHAFVELSQPGWQR